MEIQGIKKQSMDFFGVKGNFQKAETKEMLFIKNREVKGDTFTQKMENTNGYLDNVTAEEILGEGWDAVNINEWGEDNVKANKDAGFEELQANVLLKQNEDGSRTYKKILFNEKTGQYARVQTTINADGSAERTFEVEENASGQEEIQEETLDFQLQFLLKQAEYIEQGGKNDTYSSLVFSEYKKTNNDRISEILAKMTGNDAATIKKELDEGKINPEDYLKKEDVAEPEEKAPNEKTNTTRTILNSQGAEITQYDESNPEEAKKVEEALVVLDQAYGDNDKKLSTDEFKNALLKSLDNSEYSETTINDLKNVVNSMDTMIKKYADEDNIFSSNEYLSMLNSAEYQQKTAEINDIIEKDGSLEIMNRHVKGYTIKQKYQKGDKDNDKEAKDVLGEGWSTLNTKDWGEKNLQSNFDQGFKTSDEGTLVKENEDGSKTYKQILKRTTGQYARILTTIHKDGTIERQMEVEKETEEDKGV